MSHPIGSTVRVTNSRTTIGGPAAGEPGSYVGAIATVTGHEGEDSHLLNFEDEALNDYGTWSTRALDLVEEREPVGRPTVNFDGSSRATAREYAKAANSRVLTTASQNVLKRAALGGEVDAYALNEAVLDAMRSGATRLGQSMARRDLTRKIAYLGHIVQAVLENHADELPAYEPGARSRRVEELSRENSHTASVNQSLARDLTTLKQAASDERRRLTQEIDDLRRQVETEQGAYAALKTAADDRDKILTDTVNDRDALAATLAYTLEMFTDEEEAAKARVLGFYDGASTVLS
jgi:hypothetical protein